MAGVPRVLLISGEYLPWRRGGRFHHLLALAMAEQGVPVHVLTSVQDCHRRKGGSTVSSPALLLPLAPLYRSVRYLLHRVRPSGDISIRQRLTACIRRSICSLCLRSVPTV